MLKRIAGSGENFYRAVEHSFMISADNAHGYHPNYGEKYDPTNHPLMGRGPVIKFNASQKYSSDADSAAVFKAVCEKAEVPYQTFVNHSDVAGGSTSETFSHPRFLFAALIWEIQFGQCTPFARPAA